MKVKCIDDYDCDNLTNGRIYNTIDVADNKHTNTCYFIKNDYNMTNYYNKNRFEKIKKIKKIKCINGRGFSDLTEGKVYDVIEEMEDYYVIFDDKEEYRYLKSRFEVVEEYKAGDLEQFDLDKHWEDFKKENTDKLFDFDKDLKRFENGKIVVNCRTGEDAKDFITKCYKNGLGWVFDSSNQEKERTRYKEYKKNTCYSYSGAFDGINLSYIERFKDINYTILQYKAKPKPTPKSLLRTGDIVTYANGDKRKVLFGVEKYMSKFYLINENKHLSSSDSNYNNNLEYNSFPEYSISKIERPVITNNLLSFDCKTNLIWERKSPKIIKREITDSTPEGHTVYIEYNGNDFYWKCGCFKGGNTKEALDRLLEENYSTEVYMDYVSKMNQLEKEMKKEWDEKYKTV